MKFIHNLTIIATAIAVASCAAPKKVPYVVDSETIPTEILSQVPSSNDPVLGPGDLLNIDVSATNMASVVPFNKGMYLGENGQIQRIQTAGGGYSSNGSESSTEYYLVNSAGDITFPMLGEIHVTGMTKSELAQTIADAIYPRYIKEKPKVEVRLMNFRVVLTGAVRNPGIYQSRNERMNFFEAIAMAGDLDLKGDREHILLYRTNSDGTREIHSLNINDKNFLLSPYFNLQQNDIIYVYPTKYLSQNAWQINPAVGATITYIGGLSSLAGLIIGIINLANK